MAKRRYRVRAGDNPLDLAKRFRTTQGEILRANGIKNLTPGQTINVPNATAMSLSRGTASTGIKNSITIMAASNKPPTFKDIISGQTQGGGWVMPAAAPGSLQGIPLPPGPSNVTNQLVTGGGNYSSIGNASQMSLSRGAFTQGSTSTIFTAPRDPNAPLPQATIPQASPGGYGYGSGPYNPQTLAGGYALRGANSVGPLPQSYNDYQLLANPFFSAPTNSGLPPPLTGGQAEGANIQGGGRYDAATGQYIGQPTDARGNPIDTISVFAGRNQQTGEAQYRQTVRGSAGYGQQRRVVNGKVINRDLRNIRKDPKYQMSRPNVPVVIAPTVMGNNVQDLTWRVS